MQVSQKLFTQSFIPDDAAQPIGFCLHLCDLYISELETCCNKSDSERLPHAAAVVLLHPFLEVLQRSQQPTLIARIKYALYSTSVRLQHSFALQRTEPEVLPYS